MNNTFHQTNHSGSMGTQGQVGDNTQNVTINTNEQPLKPLIEEIEKQAVDAAWDDSVDPAIKEEFETPSVMLEAAFTEAAVDIEQKAVDTPEDDGVSEKTLTWTERLKNLAPLGIKIASKVAIGVIKTYSPVSPVLEAIGLTLLEELETD